MQWPYTEVQSCPNWQIASGKLIKDNRTQKESVQVPAPYMYEVGFGKRIRQLCSTTFGHSKVAKFQTFIGHKMTYRLYLDGLPSAVILKRNPKKHTEIL